MKGFLFIFLIINVTYCTGQSNFFDAIRSGNLLFVKQNLQKDNSLLNKPNDNNHSPLIIAVYSGQTEIVEMLLNQGAHIESKFDQGTALHGAAYKGHIKITQLLINNNANVNATDATNITPLMYATLFNHNTLAQLLYKSGANPNMQDLEGNSAVEYAKQLNNIELIQLYKTFQK